MAYITGLEEVKCVKFHTKVYFSLLVLPYPIFCLGSDDTNSLIKYVQSENNKTTPALSAFHC